MTSRLPIGFILVYVISFNKKGNPNKSNCPL
jgi:hypothetical protein